MIKMGKPIADKQLPKRLCKAKISEMIMNLQRKWLLITTYLFPILRRNLSEKRRYDYSTEGDLRLKQYKDDPEKARKSAFEK